MRIRPGNPFLFLAFAIPGAIILWAFLRVIVPVMVQIIKEHMVWYAIAFVAVAAILIAWLT
jgi:hypothetical protein